jgi:hyperosmotically inducible protein
MKLAAYAIVIGISMLLAGGLSACNKPGPAESAGQKIDKAVDKTEKKIDDTADKVEKKLNDK